VDTSGWETGVSTITVELRNPSAALIPDGSGYGYLGVGQTVGISHAVEPILIAPGAVTVTTVITTEILTEGIISGTGSIPYSVFRNPLLVENTEHEIRNTPLPQALLPSSTFPITRTEDIDPGIIYFGTWTLLLTDCDAAMSIGSL
jgi:hypothetical protein